MSNQGQSGFLPDEPFHLPLRALELEGGWEIDYSTLSAQTKYKPYLDHVSVTNFSALYPNEDRFHLSFHAHFDTPIPEAARPFLSWLSKSIEARGIVFAWGDRMFNVRLDIIDSELFEPRKVDDLAHVFRGQLLSGESFVMSCAHVLQLWYGSVLTTGRLHNRWIPFQKLADFCFLEPVGNPPLFH